MTTCCLCLASSIDQHHVCGRPSPASPYFSEITIPLCRRCHAREHVVLRRLGIEWLPTGISPLCHQVARLTVIVGRLADEGCPLVLDIGSTRALHTLLVETGEALTICGEKGDVA